MAFIVISYTMLTELDCFCFLGSENDYVILSTVRSLPDPVMKERANIQWRRKFIGFVSDPHQINVAITRARTGLCIVGRHCMPKFLKLTDASLFALKGRFFRYYPASPGWATSRFC